MLHILSYTPDWRSDPVLCAMFAARKQVFVDLLEWQVPVEDNHYEIDAFDGEGAIYLVLTDDHGQHQASTRLLPTQRPHLLDSLFGALTMVAPPTGPGVREITRFCLDRRLRAPARRVARDTLVSVLVDHALASGITTYTGVAERGWFRQIEAFGWHCQPLGLPRPYQGQILVALRIDITAQTPGLLAQNAIYRPLPGTGDHRHAA